MKILMLTQYEKMGASSRMRSMLYLPHLKSAGIEVRVQALLSDQMLLSRYQTGSYSILSLLCAYGARIWTLLACRKFDLIWIEKQALPFFPLSVELAFLQGIPFALDYDDAIFHNYDQHKNRFVRSIFGRRLDGLMARSALVVCGNNYLAQRARAAGAQLVKVIPTVVDLDHYIRKSPSIEREAVPQTERVLRIVWIGSPSTVHYLFLLSDALREVATVNPFILRVIGGGPVQMLGVNVESVPWSSDSEVEEISACDIGIMPLLDSAWERGKCGYKLIQYMACGLPVVASNVGVNSEIVTEDLNGYLAIDQADWVRALNRLLQSKILRVLLGAAGFLRVQQKYCLQKTAPLLAHVLSSIAKAP